MKKMFILLGLFMLMICTAFTALADYQAGDVVTVTVSVSNPNGACAFDVYLNYDRSALEFVNAAGQNGAVGGGKGFSWAELSPFGGGTIGTVTFRVKDTAVPGNTYTITAYCADAADIDDNVVKIGVSTSGGTVKVAAQCDHNWDNGVITKPATCLSNGEKKLTCTLCGKTKVSVVEAPGHTPGDNTRVDQEPTCTVDGKGSYQCAACGEWVDNGVIPATGHDLKETVTAATCGKDGQKVTACTKCDHSETTVIKATGKHTYDEGTVTTEPACGKEGVKTFTCTVCGSKKTEKIEALKHDYTAKVTAEATCGKEGVKTFTCTTCGDTYEEKIPATGAHTYEEKTTVAPTCVNKGEKTTTCSVCGDTKKEDIPATGHQPGSDLKQQDPTCTKTGYKYFTCTVCGAEVKEDSIPATGEHIYKVTEETPATCTKKGSRVSTCTYGCGKKKTETLKALGHKMGEWALTTAPTCTEKGTQTRVCENGCGKTETKSVKAVGHKMGEWATTTAPTCTEKGTQTCVCENGCGKTETRSVKALGHDWDEWVITKPVTEKEPGERKHTCKRCGEVETKKISNLVDYHMTVCTEGIRFRDLKNPITKEWYMFTPIDLSVEGTQTFNLIAGNMHKIGTATVLVQNGNVTVTYKVNNTNTIFVSEEFMTILPSLADVTRLDFEGMTNYAYGEPISIEETLGGDTKVLLLLRNRVAYQEGARGVESFNGKGKAYNALVEELKQLMD